MKEKILRKTIVCGIIVLFIGAGFATGINGKINRPDINEKTLYNSSIITNQNICSLTFHTFDKKEEKQNNVNLPTEVANNIYNKLEKLKYMIVQKPRSDETQNLKIEFVDLLDNYGLIPAGLTKNNVLSLLNPSWLKNKQKTPKTKNILSKNYISHVAEKIVNLQQTFKNCFGKTVPNIFDKNIILSPSGKTTATASFCSISSGGSGKTLPIFLLPRPRAIAVWTASDAITMVGELVTAKGFYAGGAQSGSMLGFTGMGLTYSLPGYIVYGFVGYALYTKVSADYIEFVNQEPIISDENPSDGDYDVPVSLSKLSFKISDPDGDLMNYTVITNPNIGSGSGNNKKNGIYTVSISGLEGYTKYTWHVVVNDKYNTVEKYFTFTTEAVAPVVLDPLPSDDAKYIPVDLSQLSFNLKDFQGDLMDYTVETSPNIGSNSGNDVGDGTYTCGVNGLKYSTEYKWYVNVTDGAHWTHKVFSFQTELKMVFNPFEEGWNYRKQITIDHSVVAGDLVNFPVLISTVDSDLQDKAQDDGDDILFMNGSGIASRLYHEIELFDGSSGKLIAWVNLTNLSSTVDTILYMYYGNPTCSNQQNKERTWNSDYRMVQHLNDVTTSTIIGSTGYLDMGDNAGYPMHKKATNEPVEIDGKIGKGQDFDGTNDYIGWTYDEGYPYMEGDHCDFNTSNTISVWFKSPDGDAAPPVWSVGAPFCGRRGGGWLSAFGLNQGKLAAFCWDDNGAHRFQSVDSFNDNEWYYAVFTRTRDATYKYNGILNAYVDGNLVIDTQTFNFRSTDTNLGIWQLGATRLEYFDGILDEYHTSTILRSTDWISTEYNNQNSPSSFLGIGPEESGL